MIPIHVLLKKFVQENSRNEEFLQSYLQIMWEKLVGKEVARFSKVDKMKNNVLVVSVSDPELLKILTRMEIEILKKISAIISKDTVRNIKFIKRRKHVAEETLMKNKNEEPDQTMKLKEASFIVDDELREYFNKAYGNYQKTIIAKKKSSL